MIHPPALYRSFICRAHRGIEHEACSSDVFNLMLSVWCLQSRHSGGRGTGSKSEASMAAGWVPGQPGLHNEAISDIPLLGVMTYAFNLSILDTEAYRTLGSWPACSQAPRLHGESLSQNKQPHPYYRV